MKSIQDVSYKTLFTILFFSLAGIIFFLRIGKPANKVSAAWWDEMWHYRQAINISSHTSSESNVYIITTVNIGTTTKAQVDDGDFRFISQSGENLNYYISSGVGTSTISFHILIPSFPAGAQTIYAYYGNPSASNGFSDSDFSTQASNYTIGSLSTEEIGGGPIAYWKFDEGIGTTIYDSGPNQKNGYFSTTAPTWADEDQCVSGNCLSFNGTQTAVSNYDISWNNTNSISLSFWVKPQNVTETFKGIIGKSFYEWTIHQHGNTVQLLYWNNTAFHTNGMGGSWGNVLSVNKWVHLAYTWNGSTAFFYADGKLVNTAIATNPTINKDTTLPMKFGGQLHTTGTTYFKGLIDEVKIYDYTRTADQIKQDYNSRGSISGSSVNLGVRSNTAPSLKSSLVAHWKFDEGNSTNAYDSINSKGYSIDNAISWQSNDCLLGKCIYSTGATLTNNIVSNFDYNIIKNSYENSSWTLSAWVKPNGNQSGNERVIVGRIGCHSGLMVNVNSFMFQIYNEGCSDTKAIVYTPPNMTDWYYLSAVYNQRNMYLYVNGKLVGTNTMSENIFTHNNNLFIGGVDSWAFKGWIDEVKVYNRALAAEEIKQDYNQGSAIQFGSTNQTIGGTTTSLEYCIPGDTSYCAPPVAEWNFEENTGTIAKDTSGNNNNGTFGTGNSAPTWSLGQNNKGAGLKFDGINDYVIINDPGINGTNNFSIEYWLKNDPNVVPWTNSLSFGTNLFRFETDDPATTGFHIFNPGIDSSSISCSNCLKPNSWNHLVLTSNSSNWYLYVNGILKNSGITTGTLTGSSNIYLGVRYLTGQIWKGLIDQLYIYNYARTPAQIAYDYNKGAPIGWWKFDECQGSVAHDSSGFNNHGNISIGQSGTQTTLGTCQTGTSAAWTNGASGKINSSLNFDGTDDNIDLGNINIGTTTNNLSVSVWINPKEYKYAEIFRKSHSSGYSWSYKWRIVSQDLYFAIQDTSGNYHTLSFNPKPNLNEWTHLMSTYDGTTGKAYKNGQLISSFTSSFNIRYDNNPIYIGGASGEYFNGQIDDTRIYNYALTEEQVKQVYNGGAVNFR